MSSNKQKSVSSHEWTSYEMHTLICLMVKGLHREGKSKKSDEPGLAKKRAHLEVATALNDVVHKNDYDNDVPKREVSRMIDQILVERKAIFGPNGYVDRLSPSCMTRGLKRMWDRSTKFDFNGSMNEWSSGRRERVMARHWRSNGIDVAHEPPKKGEFAVGRAEDSDEESPRKKRARLGVDASTAADNATAYSQTNSRGSSQEMPTPMNNTGIPIAKGLDDLNLDTNSAQTGHTQVPDYTSSYLGVPSTSYQPSYAPGTARFGQSSLPPPPGPSFGFQNITLAKEISLNLIALGQAEPQPFKSSILTGPERTDDLCRGPDADDVHKMLDQKDDGAKSPSSADTKDNDENVGEDN